MYYYKKFFLKKKVFLYWPIEKDKPEVKKGIAHLLMYL